MSETCAWVHELFEQHTERVPERIALISEGQAVSYAGLNRRSNQLGNYLRRLGVGPEVVVGVCLRRSVEMVVALLGVLKAGGAYLPLDAESPLERTGYMLEDAGVGVTLTERKLEERLPAFWGQIVLMDDDWESIGAESESLSERAPMTEIVGENLAYVIYTSGSSGRPKGVIINHGGLINYLKWASEAYRVEEGEGAPVNSSIGFDLTVTSLYLPLINGKSVNLLSEEEGVDALAEALSEGRGYSLVKITPAHLEVLAQQLGEREVQGGTKALVIGGEELRTGGLNYWRERAGGTRLINEYGPTETVVGCCVYEVNGNENEKGAAPIGRPIPNTQIYILSHDQEPAPVGVKGEIYISGKGVARGYVRSPELTGEKFIPNLFSGNAGDRCYRTGDFGRYRADGNIEFLGRADGQVKLRGYRIELGEIGAALNQHRSVKQSVVIAREDDGGIKRLIGYVVGEEGAKPAELKRHLRERLPEYMIPEAIVVLKEMPLTANGKIDRKKLLLVADAGRQVEQEYIAPRTPLEEMVAGIFRDVLSLDRVGIHDNFFEIGGHSLLAIQVISRVRNAFEVEVGMKGIFDAPTAEGLSRNIEEAMKAGEKAQAPPLVRIEREGTGGRRVPLSFAQQRLWFIDKLNPGGAVYNIPGSVILEGALDLDALERSVNEIVRRHEVLRTRIEVEGVEPSQLIDDWEPRRLEVIDLTSIPPEEREAEVGRRAREEAETGFDLSRGPLLRLKALKLEEEKHVLLYTMHHIVSDEWSTGILIKEVGTFYQSYLEGEESPLPELEVQYADFAVWQRSYLAGEVLEKEVGYWREQLRGAAALELPADRARPAAPSYRGGLERFELGHSLSEGLRKLSQRGGLTIFMTLMAAFKALLMRYGGQEDISVGTAIANRTRKEVEGLIGFFVNTLVMRTDLSGNPSFRELMRREREVALGAYAHQELPFEKLVEELNPDRDLSRNPLFQAMMILEHAGRETLELPGVKLSGLSEGIEIGGEGQGAKFDLTLSMADLGQELIGVVEYSRDLFDAGTIGRLVNHYVNVLQGVVKDGERLIRSLDLLGEGERKQIVEEWNATEADHPKEKFIHELFEEQAERSPHAVALIYEEQNLTYGELNVRANRLAHHLRKFGVGPEARVAMRLERSLEMVVAMLATLKAGGAYVPLDPAYPSGRLAYMLEDSEPAVLLTQGAVRSAPAPRLPAIPMLDLESDQTQWDAQSEQNPEHGAAGSDARSLAYIIYTSGSTGAPKGVMVGHANVVRLMESTGRWFGFGPADVWTLFHSYAFDFSVWEMWGALAYGGRLVIVPQATTRSPEEFHGLLRRAGVTVLNQTPSAFRQLISVGSGKAERHELRHVIFGGEALDVGMLKPWYGRNEGQPTRLVNMYGITETTVHVTCRLLEESDTRRSGASPIGRRIPDMKTYILGAYGELAPVGVKGELHVGGAGVARGYLNRPELTAERFQPDANGQEAGARIYKTGDLGRWLSEGEIEFLGRNDSQVKIRGYRIELGEIEAGLMSHPEVEDAVVIAAEGGVGSRRLIAYYTGREMGAEALRAHLAEALPDYMAPAAYVRLERMPLTPNGKLDRRALPAPEGGAYLRRGYEEPLGERERKLARIWAEALKLDRVGRNDNFFELGGHSLLVITVIERMRREGMEADARTLFTAPTLQALAEAVKGRRENEVEAPPNLIPAGCGRITPEMLPLIALRQEEIECGGGYDARRCGQHPGHLSIGAVAGGDTFPSLDEQ